MGSKKDDIYANRMDKIADFAFDRNVADVFDDMLHRSIPGYDAVIHQVGAFAARYVQPNTNIYDLGCSLGAATFAVRNSVDAAGCVIIPVDLSEDMIGRFERRLQRHKGVLTVQPRCMDISELPIENASLVVMNFTLQFIDTGLKDRIVQNIFNGLRPLGALILSEKIVFEDAAMQQFIEQSYFDFKRYNGYNDLEISQKRDALENVLKLETTQAHVERLKRVGFSTVACWYQNLNFASFIAVKAPASND
ncbi:MAG: carboxy-S-adenosyl-L-methionine synthase CmoA [Deltaproteobacteria bacterium]|nr:carboxy-S-adenosyl-L-methionine synthase CmoA [Deltaproteobacteria bacterium]